MLRVVIVEDEPLGRAHLRELLEEQPDVQVVAEAENGRLGLKAIAEHRPDAVFLDIEMPGMKGTEVMQALPEPRPALIFVTAYADHALEAIQGGAIHYVLKPVNRLAIAQALSRLHPKGSMAQRALLRLPVKRRQGTLLLDPSEVEALVADVGDCQAWTSEGRLPIDGSLGYWEERLLDRGFHRVHRNALVRLDAIKELTAEDEVILPSGRISVSRRRMEELKQALGLV